MAAAFVLVLLVTALILFATEKVTVDLVTLFLISCLALTGILTPREIFEGFSSDIIIVIASIFVVSAALQRSGILDRMGGWVYQMAQGKESRLLAGTMTAASALSAFMNNTVVTAMLLPPVLGAAHKARISPSRLLMPLAYASILGGTCTLIGTSTNVAVSGYIAKSGLEPIGLFELAPVGLVLVVAGILYMMFVGKYFLPSGKENPSDKEEMVRNYLSEILITPGSSLAGQKMFDSEISRLDFQILKVLRGKQALTPNQSTTIEEGDLILVEGPVEQLMKVKDTGGFDIKAELKLSDLESQDNVKVAETLVTRRSNLIGNTLKGIRFRQRYGLTALALFRDGQKLRKKVSEIRLQFGDLLLVQGDTETVDSLSHHPDLMLLEEVKPHFSRRHGFFAVAAFVGALFVGGMGWVPLSVAMLIAAVLCLLFRCLSTEEAYEQIDWRLLILIGGMTAFGTAMEKTGAAQLLADGLVTYLAPLGIMTVLAGFFVLTIVLTQVMSNAAAALVVLPVAMQTAVMLGLNPRSFAVAIMLAASVSFVTPLEPSCILVYGPGNYRFVDFIKTGLLLTILLSAIVLVLLPVFWPLALP